MGGPKWLKVKKTRRRRQKSHCQAPVKAREEGQLARSQETTIAASVICVASFIYLFGESLFKSISDDFAAGLFLTQEH